jgi:hypothetical protein
MHSQRGRWERGKYENKKDMDFYCKIMSYEQKISNWFLIMLDGISLNSLDVNFKYFK